MDVASALAQRGASEGTVVQADLQTAGRGRSGRVWEAAAGSSLMLSVILRPPRSVDRLGLLSLLSGLAVAKTVEALTSRAATIKWPNDVLLDGRKVAGVLIQSRVMATSGSRHLILGIGLNVRSTPGLHRDRTTSLSEAANEPVELSVVMHRLLIELDDAYRLFLDGNLAVPLAGVNDRLAYRDQHVEIVDGARTIRGAVVGLGKDGELLLRQPDGCILPVVSGELTRGPRLVHG